MDADVTEPLVSIITVNYNGLAHLQKLLPGLKKCSYPNVEIIVVDNASEDDSVRYVQSNFPDIKLIQNNTNRLFAGANNEGLEKAQGEICCLINNDVVVDAGFIEPIVSEFLQNKTLAACQPKILDMQKPDHFEYAGAAGGFIDALGYPFLRGRLFFDVESDVGQYESKTGLFWASGACLFLRRSALNDVGLFDEVFKLHMEEIDLCWRLRLAGWEIIYHPGSKIWHLGGGTLAQADPQKLYWNFRNNIFLLVKNLASLNLAVRLPVRFALDVSALIWEMVHLRFSHALAIVKAYLWLALNVPIIWKKRRYVQKKRRMKDSVVLKRTYPGSIIVEYFIFKKRTFDKLWRITRLKKFIEYRDGAA